MRADRRDFLRHARAAGLVIPAWAWLPVTHAATAYSGKILVDVYANGGLDQSSWTDPRETDKTINEWAVTQSAVMAGHVRVAPMANNAAFFNAYYPQMLVINGINTETNAHVDGRRCHATGRLDLGYPHLDELYAHHYGTGLPMAWMNDDGAAYANSAGLVPPTAIPNANQFRSLLQPNAFSITQDHMKPADLQKALAARAQRLQAQQAAGKKVPRLNNEARQFLAAADGRALLSSVATFLPDTFDTSFPAAHVGLVAAQAGITSAIQLSVGQFDSHTDHTAQYTAQLPMLTNLVDFIWQKAAALGLSQRIFMRIYSEFGRTALNSGNGKDHLSAGGTMILMEAAPVWGNRVVGATGPRHESLKINVNTGAVDAVNGVTLTPRHVHAAIRKYLGITTDNPRFNLKVPAAQEIDFFNPAITTGYPNL